MSCRIWFPYLVCGGGAYPGEGQYYGQNQKSVTHWAAEQVPRGFLAFRRKRGIALWHKETNKA